MKVDGFQLCSESEVPTGKPDRVANLKHDGRRVKVRKEGNKVTLWGRDYITASNFPEIVASFQKIPHDFVVDTEFAVFTERYRTNRGFLQTRDRTKDKFKIRLLTTQYPATAIIFDVLEFDTQDLKNEEYSKRKEIIKGAFDIPLDISEFEKPPTLMKAHDWKNPNEAWELAQAKQLEGIVEKDIHSKYIGKRADTWTKVKRKEIITRKMVSYEVSNAGITLISDIGDRVAAHGQQHIPVKVKIDNEGFANVQCRRMAGETAKGKSREIVFWKLVENEQRMDNKEAGVDSNAPVHKNNTEREKEPIDKHIQPTIREAGKGGGVSPKDGAKPNPNRNLARFGF